MNQVRYMAGFGANADAITRTTTSSRVSGDTPLQIMPKECLIEDNGIKKRVILELNSTSNGLDGPFVIIQPKGDADFAKKRLLGPFWKQEEEARKSGDLPGKWAPGIYSVKEDGPLWDIVMNGSKRRGDTETFILVTGNPEHYAFALKIVEKLLQASMQSDTQPS